MFCGNLRRNMISFSRIRYLHFRKLSSSAVKGPSVVVEDDVGNMNSNEGADDLYGIESDKDVLCFEEKPICLEKFSHFFEKKKEVDEVVRTTSFGAIRLDSWNQGVSYKSENFPDSSRSRQKQLIKKELLEATNSPSKSQLDLFNDSPTSSTTNKHDMNKYNTHVSTSYIDDAYFGSVLSEDSKNSLNTGDIHIKYQQNQHSPKLNMENFDSAQGNEQYLSPKIVIHTGANDGGNISYIDDEYFASSLHDEKTSSVCEQQSLEMDKKPIPTERELTMNIERPNAVTVCKDSVKHNICNLNEVNSQEPSLNNEESETRSDSFLSEIDRQYFGECLKESRCAKEKLFEEKKEICSSEDMLDRYSIKNNVMNSPEGINDVKADAITWSEPDILVGINDDVSHVENNTADVPSTAQEFVAKLRKKRLKTQVNERGELILPAENIQDSKGYRILKNQVPDLSDLTRDELLLLLKNNVLYSNDDLLIIDKPYNLVIHDAEKNKEPSLSKVLDEFAQMMDTRSSHSKLYTVHRLDKETTGCFILARNERTAAHIKALFAQQKILKKYWIITTRVPDPFEGVIDIPISEGTIGTKRRMVLSPEIPKDLPYRSHSKKGKKAITHYRVMSVSDSAALVEAVPETGLKHQIRVHFGFGLGCPILGDHKYSHLDKLAPQKLSGDILQKLGVRQSKVRYIPMHIHAHSVTIPQILHGRNLFISAPLPYHMGRNLKSLKFRKN